MKINRKYIGLILIGISFLGIFFSSYLYLNKISFFELKPKEELKAVSLPDIELAPLPYRKPGFTDFGSNSNAIKTIDVKTGFIFTEKNPGTKLKVASLSKLMTALLVMENAKRTDIITVGKINTKPGEAQMGLVQGEKIKVEELVKALLVHSAGDAASALAIHISGNESEFVKSMNKRGEELDLKDTKFTNTVGLDEAGSFSTANDLINLSRLLLTNKDFREIISITNYQAKNESGKVYQLTNTNKILDNVKVFGLKTGYTLEAGECLISLAKENNHEILTIVLGSPDRFGETRSLIDWVYKNHSW